VTPPGGVREDDGPVTETTVLADPRAGTRLRIERAALALFTRQGFDQVTTDQVADAAGISRRTYFRYFATKADAVWGDFTGHGLRLAELLDRIEEGRSVLSSIHGAYVEVNAYPDVDLPMLRQRLRLILTEPALQAHSQVRYAEVDRVVAEHVARRTGASPTALVPRLVAMSTRAAATTAFEVWLADDEGLPLAHALHDAFDELATGFPSLRLALPVGS
jgi:TetR/AcrR family transcriptional regulator, regulator of mycofactocin system